MFARYRIACLGVLVSVLFSGCAYYNYNQQFFADCRTHIPEIRAYAIEHLPRLSDADRQTIATTEPRLAQANFVSAYFTWPDVGKVACGAPPDCEPFDVVDLRPSK